MDWKGKAQRAWRIVQGDLKPQYSSSEVCFLSSVFCFLVVSCGVRGTSCEMRVVSCGLRVASFGLRVTGYEVRYSFRYAFCPLPPCAFFLILLPSHLRTFTPSFFSAFRIPTSHFQSFPLPLSICSPSHLPIFFLFRQPLFGRFGHAAAVV